MKKTFRTTLYLFLLFLALSVSVYAKNNSAPLWVSDINSVYNENEYVACLGSGKTQELAKMEALNFLSEYFRTKIHTEGAMTRVATSGANSSYATSAVQQINVQSDAELFCVEYDFYFDKKAKKNYCVAFINKEKYWKQARPRIENKKQEFEKYYSEAEKLFSNEPILAKKYYIFSLQSGDGLLESIQQARLIVGDKANAYSKDENRFYEVQKKIKDAENATVIFIEVEGDWTNTATSKVKTLFESEGYNFTSNRKKCSHVMKIMIEQNLLVNGAGSDYETVSVAPSIEVTLINPYTQQNIFSFSRKAPKGVAFDKNIALRKGFDSLCREMDRDLIENFKQKMLGL